MFMVIISKGDHDTNWLWYSGNVHAVRMRGGVCARESYSSHELQFYIQAGGHPDIFCADSGTQLITPCNI